MRNFPNYLPKYGARPDVQFRTLTSSFGDGYSQRGKDGINNRLNSWPLTFELRTEDMLNLQTFLDDHQGVEAFLWAPPDESEGKWVCKGYTGPADLAPGWLSLTTMFERVFDL
ncbi:hypothetical protein TDB9533_01228 [Thalassocella blandensis]|nr:hypothetical protein TDB9533_01228 [Thalassocella blandensis]